MNLDGPTIRPRRQRSLARRAWTKNMVRVKCNQTSNGEMIQLIDNFDLTDLIKYA